MGYYVALKDQRKTNMKSYLSKDKMNYSQLTNSDLYFFLNVNGRVEHKLGEMLNESKKIFKDLSLITQTMKENKIKLDDHIYKIKQDTYKQRSIIEKRKIEDMLLNRHENVNYLVAVQNKKNYIWYITLSWISIFFHVKLLYIEF